MALTSTEGRTHPDPDGEPRAARIRDQFDAGRGADPEKAVGLNLALASGKADRLSGRHLCVSENLESLLARIDEIERDDLHTLRLRTGRADENDMA